jgi:hypothetical protein
LERGQIEEAAPEMRIIFFWLQKNLLAGEKETRL